MKKICELIFGLSLPALKLLFLAALLSPFMARANICLHPLEQLALFHGNQKPSLEKRIKAAEKKLESAEENKEEIEEEIGEKIQQLRNSLDESNERFNSLREDEGGNPIGSADDAADLIAAYMEDQLNQWKDMPEGEPIAKNAPWAQNARQYFKSNGGIDEDKFCKEYSLSDRDNQKDCKDAIEDIRDLYEDKAELEDIIDDIDDDISALTTEKRKRSLRSISGDEEDTEANGLCFECLEELRELDRPTAGQTIGNLLSVVAGGAMSYYGYKAGQREGRSLNNLRLQQGYDPVSSSGMAWAGATLGMPFIANGIYGLAGGNSNLGNYACSPGYASGRNMYGAFNYGNPYAQAQAGAGMYGPWGGNPFGGAQAGIQFGGNPWGGQGGMYGPWGGNPFGGLQAGIQFGGGGNWGNPWGGQGGMYGPWGGNPFGGMQAGIQFGGGGNWGNPWGGQGGMYGPWGGNPFGGLQAGIQFGGGGNWGNPWGGQGGMYGPWGGNQNMMPNIQAQYQQQQYAQYMQFQQQQMQAQIQMRQAWLQHQQSLQQDWMRRQQVIGDLHQEIHKIQQQIQMVASGGVTSSLGVNTASFNTGANLGAQMTGAANAPQHQPAVDTGRTTGQGDLPVTYER